jgi:ammonia channel protein AmtB
MRTTRTTYFALITVTIIVGLLSRHINGVPLFIGDILWALMVYFIVRFIFINQTTRLAVIASLFFSYGIEFSQLYQAPWINSIRHTVIGGLVLGQTFLWSDMLCYTVGIGIGVGVDLFIKTRR